MQPMDETIEKPRHRDVANVAALVRDAARDAVEDTVLVHTPYGKATVHVDRHGVDVQLPGGATVHVRVGSDS